LLIGHSLGGAAILAAAAEVPEARAVVTIAAPADPAHAIGLFKDRIPEINARGEAEVVLAGQSFRIRREFLDDLAGQRLIERIARLQKALLVFHAPLDETVGIDNANRISRRPNIRKASSRCLAPITCSAARAMQCTWVT
jgi:pimeloyl-ACP methyl ester carboxylesterase